MKCFYVNMKQWAIIAIVCLLLCWDIIELCNQYYFSKQPLMFLMCLFGASSGGVLVAFSCFCVGLWTGIPMTKVGIECKVVRKIMKMFTGKK